jgi:predicted membrane protein
MYNQSKDLTSVLKVFRFLFLILILLPFYAIPFYILGIVILSRKKFLPKKKKKVISKEKEKENVPEEEKKVNESNSDADLKDETE